MFFLKNLILKKPFTLIASLLIGVLSGCGQAGNTMKITDFFESDMVELITAIEKGDETKARALIENGLSLNVHGNEGITPLFWLTMKLNKSGMRLAIKLGADPDFADPDGDTPITMVAGGNDDEMLLILLEGGANPNTIDSDGHPTMFEAVREERLDQIKMLIRFGANINLMDRSGANSALYGSDINRYEMVHYLIEQGVDYTVRDATRGDIAWNVHEGLSKNLLSPEFPAYGWAVKVKQQLIDRGVEFPPPSPREVRWQEGKPNKYDTKARLKELDEAIDAETDPTKKKRLLKEFKEVKGFEKREIERVKKIREANNNS